jgi:glucose-6-phosphate-specific signal transduction histidine kinase
MMVNRSISNIGEKIKNLEKAIKKARRVRKKKSKKQAKKQLKKESRRLYLESRRVFKYYKPDSTGGASLYAQIIELLEKAGEASKVTTLKRTNKRRIKKILNDLKPKKAVFLKIPDKIKDRYL